MGIFDICPFCGCKNQIYNMVSKNIKKILGKIPFYKQCFQIYIYIYIFFIELYILDNYKMRRT